METELTQEVKTGTRDEDKAKLYPLTEGDSDSLLIHCSDPRFQDAFYEFTRKELGLKRPAPITIPGCTASFGVQGFMPKRWHALRSWIELMAEHNKFQRVVIINHDDCKGYSSVAKFLGGLANVSTSQRKHLHDMARYITNEYLPNARLELYQARLVQENGSRGVKFERVF
ncbi:MAG: hypothetical protein Q8R55_02040 [Candidatus Taylorbacteria bacterium]|nr:hypothetical protein [Candidatus Taylorbacteria bacterium]